MYGVCVVVTELVDNLGYPVMVALGEGVADRCFESVGISGQLNSFESLTCKLHLLALLLTAIIRRSDIDEPSRQACSSHRNHVSNIANTEPPSNK